MARHSCKQCSCAVLQVLVPPQSANAAAWHLLLRYQLQSSNDATGAPIVIATLLFRNRGAPEKARQQSNLLNPGIINGIIRNAALMGVTILPDTIKTSSPLGNGGAAPAIMDPVAAAMAAMGMAVPLGASNMTGMDMLGYGSPNATAPIANNTERVPSPAPTSSAAVPTAGAVLSLAVLAAGALLL